MAEPDPDTVTCEIRIEAAPETVFAFFTDPERIVQWQGQAATLDPRPGGIYRVAMSAESVACGQYVEVERYRRIVFTWGWEGNRHGVAPGSSRVEISLVPDGDGTIVRLVHRDLPAERRQAHAEGWQHYLPRLARAASGRDRAPGP